MTKPIPKDLPRQRLLYLREKARLKASKKRRILTGENWCVRIDALTKHPFWYNTDTGEAIWDKPLVLIELEAEELEMLTADEEAESLPVDEAEEIRKLRREAIELEAPAETAGKGEFVCQNCFLVKRTSQLADKRRKFCRDCV